MKKISIPATYNALHDDLVQDDKGAFVLKVAHYLHQGSLILMTGAGVSAGFGFPNWKELCRSVLSDAGHDNVNKIDSASASEYIALVDPVCDEVGFVESLHKALYGGNPKEMHLQEHLFKPLLVAIGSMLTSGSSRGRVSTIINYNYDDVIERFLTLHGYSSTSIVDYNQLESSSDTVIMHPHGMVPLKYDDQVPTGDIVFGRSSYIDRRAETGHSWKSRVSHALLSKVGLMVGLSGDDDIVNESIATANKELGAHKRPTAFAILTEGAYDRNATSLQKMGVVTLKVDKDEIPTVLLKICFLAGKM